MQRIPMSKIKEVLKFKYINELSNRQIEKITGVSRNSVANYIKNYEASELTVQEFLKLSDCKLEEVLYPKQDSKLLVKSKITHPDWKYIHQELKKKGMTRALLYEEWSKQHPNSYSYSQFNRYYIKYARTITPSMRQIHYSGDKLFIDFSGLTMPIVNAKTGEISKAQIFVSVLGASGYTFVHAVSSQSSKDFITCHANAFSFYRGVPNILVPDNLKAAVISHTKKGVKLNESYADMGRHYGVAIAPARPYKPQDKSKVELGVKGIQRWILMRLRNHTFFSVEALNIEIGKLLDLYNAKVIRRFGKSRELLFNELDKPFLQPLPANSYIYKEFKICTVGVDYHIELEGSGYSVPYTYLGKKVEVTYSETSVVAKHKGKIIAHHPKQSQPYHDSTLKEHMPSSHQYHHEKWNPRRILHLANSIGVHTTALMENIMQEKSHPVRGYKSCMAILSFSKSYGKDALEMVSEISNEFKIRKVSSIETMLKTKSYLTHYQQQNVNNSFLNEHENIRGSDYYAPQGVTS
jgi:transposase